MIVARGNKIEESEWVRCACGAKVTIVGKMEIKRISIDREPDPSPPPEWDLFPSSKLTVIRDCQD